MLIAESKKKLVFAPQDPETVLQYIPHAKAFVHAGQELVAVEHGVEESIVLRNMGLQGVPPPILHYYDWPHRKSADFAGPMDHQKQTAAFLTSYRGALCLNAPGTGKTLSSLWAADYLLTEGVVKRVLIVSPLTTVKLVWGKELKNHLPHRNFEILVGPRERKERLWNQPGVQFYIINHDGFTSFYKQLTDVDLVIYDEATAVKSPASIRFRVLFKWMAEHNPWLWMLTGTPISQSPCDAWTLGKLVKSDYVPRSYTAFRDMVMQKISMYKWVPRPEALEICKKVLQPSIRYTLDECKDLPDMNYIGRATELTPQQQKAFKDMESSMVALFSTGTVVASNAAVALGKLVQIVCGVVYDNLGERIRLDNKPRYASMLEIFDEIGVQKGEELSEKIIVFVPLRGVQDALLEQLTADGYQVAAVHGDVKKKERNDIFDAFQKTDKLNVLLAHPRVAAHGLDLTRAANVLWYAPIYSLEQYEQANARIRRLTSKGATTIFHLYATPFEKELYRRLQQRKRVLADFLNLVQGINEEVD